MKAISILGSTGSIGCNTLKVIEHLQEFRVVAFGAGKNVEKLAEQIAQFNPEFVSCEDEICAERDDANFLQMLDNFQRVASD